MPIPFIIAGVAVAAAAYGAKKGLDAKENFDDAKYYNNKAKRIYDEAQTNLNSSREQTNLQMETLGRPKHMLRAGSKVSAKGYSVKITD
jgi:hypothetical protein